MAVTPKKFYAGVPGTANTVTAVYTVPTGKTAIIKNIVVSSNGTSNARVSVMVNGIQFLSAASVNPNDTIALDLSAVANAGDIIGIWVDTANVLHIYISGVEVG
jgi:uncharacterized membrane protein YccF (DUF307 family)